MPISMDLEMVWIQFVGKAPHSRGDNNPTLFEEQTEPKARKIVFVIKDLIV